MFPTDTCIKMIGIIAVEENDLQMSSIIPDIVISEEERAGRWRVAPELPRYST